jgi:RTA1 like protein
MVASSKTANLGKNIILIGLALQIIFFGIFITTSIIFHMRARSSSQTTSPSLWQKYIYTLYISSSLILVRSVFRMIEFGAGRGSILQTSEVFLYIFDAVLMFGAMVCFNVVHPGEIIGRNARAAGDVMLNSGDESSFRPRK